MIAVAGIFARRADAECAIERLRAVGIADERLAVSRHFGRRFLRERHTDDYMSDAFRRGYERGQAYQQDLMEKFPPN